MNSIPTRIINGEPSFSIATDTVTVWMTLRGNHIAPVIFHLPQGDVTPYSLAPWTPSDHTGIDPLLEVLRGDFWCMPFGAQPDGRAHGEVANAQWSCVELTEDKAHLRMHAQDLDAQVDKFVSVRQGQTALFQEFRISGLKGFFSYGTHPILDLSQFPFGTARISTGATRWASVFPDLFSRPELGENQVLEPGAVFDKLSEIPAIEGGTFDLSRYPTTTLHEDLVMLTQKGDERGMGWTAVSVPGYVWFALKNIEDFPSTLLWVSNGGRTQNPWNGRHLGRLGVEDVCSFFHEGLMASREDRLAHLGIATAREFNAQTDISLRVLQSVVPSPTGFGRVATIETPSPNIVRITDEFGEFIEQPLNWEYVM